MPFWSPNATASRHSTGNGLCHCKAVLPRRSDQVSLCCDHHDVTAKTSMKMKNMPQIAATNGMDSAGIKSLPKSVLLQICQSRVPRSLILIK